MVYRLQPFHENIGKRLTKSAKLYFTDVGLATYLLGIENLQQLARDPLRGNLFENMVIMDLVKARTNCGLDPQLFFYRDSNGNEVDLLFRRGRDYVAVEIKSAQTFQRAFTKGIAAFQNAYSTGNVKGAVVYDGEILPELDIARVFNFRDAAEIIWGYDPQN